MSKEQYIELINQLMKECEDLSAIQLVYGILASI